MKKYIAVEVIEKYLTERAAKYLSDEALAKKEGRTHAEFLSFGAASALSHAKDMSWTLPGIYLEDEKAAI